MKIETEMLALVVLARRTGVGGVHLNDVKRFDSALQNACKCEVKDISFFLERLGAEGRCEQRPHRNEN